MTFERFPNPPIKEAIFTIVFKDEISIELLENFCNIEFFQKNYPSNRKSVIRRITEGVDVASVENLQDGFLLEGLNKGERLVQARKTHISFHKIKNYEHWENLIGEFKEICDEFSKVLNQDILIKDISVRYINQIPFEGDNLREYFKLLPEEVEGVPKQLSKLFLQMTIPYGDLSCVIVETIRDSNFIIDLKVSNNQVTQLSDKTVWVSFERMRNFKNNIFFSIITDKTKNLFR